MQPNTIDLILGKESTKTLACGSQSLRIVFHQKRRNNPAS
ncbi:hypothetical protein LV89_04406 [Arcicella aurantiaca]|uniref:Uncharacterized protein n=1 Tax=Arcicella aurantiaca TaxID=591202 RepID=A0A316DHF3_9BACT|nr:hypothetical protein LV89_04406 [Arcicella aurantiaca]